MLKSNYLKIKKLIRKAFQEIEDEVLEEGGDITSVEFEELIRLSKKAIVEAMGFSLVEYEAFEEKDNKSQKEELRGFKGSKGDSIKGDEGKQGSHGERGKVGKEGEKGREGLLGSTGDQGMSGLQGEQGIQGPQGIQGEIGLDGEISKKEIKKLQKGLEKYVNQTVLTPRGRISDIGGRFFNWGMPDKDSYGTAIADSRYYKKSEVDALIAVENLWDRSDSTITPQNAGDNVIGADPTLPTHLTTRSWVEAAIEIPLSYYFTDTVSDLDPYAVTTYAMNNQVSPDAESTKTTANLSAGDDQLLTVMATPSGEPGLNQLEAGSYDSHVHAEVTVGNRSVNLYWTLTKRTTGGTDTLLMTSEITTNVTAKEDYTSHANIADEVEMGTTDRIIWKLYANVGATGSNVTIVLYDEANYDTHTTIKATSAVFNNIFLRLDGGDITGTLSIKSNNELRFYDNGNYVGFEAPALVADKIWVLPDADGNANDALTTDGSGTLSWAAAAAGGQTLYDAIVDAAGGGDYTLLSAAITAGKKSIFVRNGVYVETADIVAGSNTFITGESKEKTIIDFDSNKQLRLNFAAKCEIRNLTFIGGNGNGVLWLYFGGGSVISDCQFYSNSVDLKITGSNHNLISRCEFRSSNGVRIESSSLHTRISQCFFNEAKLGIPSGCDFTIIIGCTYFASSGDLSISADGCVIVGNVFGDDGASKRGGIQLLGNRNTLSGNVFLRGQASINAILITGNNNIVSGNTIEGATLAYDDNIALSSTANNNIISNNYIAGAAAYGVHIEGATETENIIIGNQFSGNTTADIRDLGTGTTIQNNYPVDIISGEKRFIQMKNTSGGQLIQGDIVTLKAVAAGNEITTTTAQGNDLVFGMVDETIADATTGRVQILGKTTKLKVDGTTDIAIGDFIGCFTAAKIGMKAAAGDMAIAIALEAYATNDSAGVIGALIIVPRKI